MTRESRFTGRSVDLHGLVRYLLIAITLSGGVLTLPSRSSAEETYRLESRGSSFISQGSCLRTRLHTNGAALFHLNSIPLPTFEVPGAWGQFPNGDDFNIYEAPFSSLLFRPGDNHLTFAIGASSGDDECAKSVNLVTLSSPSYGSRVVFDVVRWGTEFSGATNVHLSLMDIAPALARSIARLEQNLHGWRAKLVADAGRVAAHDAEVAAQLDLISNLTRELKALSAMGLHEISADEIAAIFSNYPSLPKDGQAALVQLVADLNKNVADLETELGRLVDDFGAQAEQVEDAVTADARANGWAPADVENYTSQIFAAAIPGVVPPDVGSHSTFDGSDDPYADYAEQTIAALQATTQGEAFDKLEFAALVRGWRKNQEAMERIVRGRATVSALETGAFLRAQNRVLAVIRTHMTDGDWFNDAPVSPELKRLVDGAIRHHFPQIAASIKDGMNLWLQRGRGEVMLEEVTVGMGSVLEHGYAEEPAEVKDVVSRVLGWVGTAATVGLGFTPVGDVLDACEAITGRELCKVSGAELTTWQRVAAGLGTVVGSGKFWSVVGASVIGVRAASEQIAEILTSPLGKPALLRSVGNRTWESRAGLRYGPDPNAEFENRVRHVLNHAQDNPRREVPHGVFDAGPQGALEVVDEAWLLAQRDPSRVSVTVKGFKKEYIVDMRRRVGFVGGKPGGEAGNPAATFMLIVIHDVQGVITAYPLRR